jgi:hypothetical protein
MVKAEFTESCRVPDESQLGVRGWHDDKVLLRSMECEEYLCQWRRSQ